MPRGINHVYLMGRLPSGEIGYSEGVEFLGQSRDRHDYDLELKPGIRVEGRLDDRLPRPVKSGVVQLVVQASRVPRATVAEHGGNAFGPGIWWSYRPIAPDGTFVFESVPPGEFVVSAHGEGFVSVRGSSSGSGLDHAARLPLRLPRAGLWPQVFAPTAPLTAITLGTVRAAPLRDTPRATASGREVVLGPFLPQSPAGVQVGGAAHERHTSFEAPFRTLPPYRALITDAQLAVSLDPAP